MSTGEGSVVSRDLIGEPSAACHLWAIFLTIFSRFATRSGNSGL